MKDKSYVFVELLSFQSFGEKVCDLIFCVDFVYFYFFVEYSFSDEVKFDVYVLSSVWL